ncbi:MAG: GNAT family N-acetyltransferase [Proteobacteria bacterium]|nr:GNAT family N-acetyltransferase [Pseudomonadota bacterium]
MTLAVRRADAGDIATLTLLFDAYRQFYGQASDLRRARAFLGARIERGESVLLLAHDGSADVGFVQLYPIFSSIRMGRVWTLNDLYVVPDARRHGVARALLDAALAFARQSGARGLQLETAADNLAAQALYRQAGWTTDGNVHFHLDL